MLTILYKEYSKNSENTILSLFFNYSLVVESPLVKVISFDDVIYSTYTMFLLVIECRLSVKGGWNESNELIE